MHWSERMKVETSVVLLIVGVGLTAACSDGGADDTGGVGGSVPTGGSFTTGGAASGGMASGGSSSLSGGAGGATGGTSAGGSGGALVLGCPSGDVPPSGDCTEWSNSNAAEVCSYDSTQCYCQTGQQGATWMCATCPADVVDEDDCSVTQMTCGECVCEMTFIQGGQREWRFSCGG